MTTPAAPAGPWTAVRHGTRWTVENVLDDTRKQPLFDTRPAAQTEADRRNHAYEQAHAPRPPQPAQTALFDQQEAS